MNVYNVMACGVQIESQDISLIEGDVLRLFDPAKYILSFSNRVEDSDAFVLWVGPTELNMLHGQACVTFLQRNGRGKEFQKVLRLKKLVRQPAHFDLGA